MCGIIGIVGREEAASRLMDGLRRLEYRGYDSAGLCTIVDGRLERRRAEGKLDNLAARARRGAAARRRSASPIPAGRPTARRPSATPIPHVVERRRRRPQRHHREFQAAARGDAGQGPHLRKPDRQRGRRPSRRRPARAGQRSRGRGRRGAAAPARRLRARDPVPRPSRHDRRRPPRRAAHRRLWRGRKLSRLRRARARRADPPHRLSRRGRLGGRHPRRGRDLRPRQPAGRPRDGRIRRQRRAHRQGQSPPFHAEGDFRAAGGRRPDARLLSAPARAEGGAARHGLLVRAGAARSPSSPAAPPIMPAWSPNTGSSASPACPCELDIASEFRYRDPVLEQGGLALFISQSGETADTLAALRHARAQGQKIAVVVNVPTSSMAREADLLLPTHAGPEIGVASTKAFTCQLAVLAALAAKVARDKGAMSEEEEREIVLHLTEAPAAMNAALGHDEDIAAMAPLDRRRPRRPLSRPRPGLSAGAGRRAETEGDQLHPRRRLCRRRDEARPDRADRRQCPDHRPRALRAAVRKDRVATCRRSRRAAARSC